MGRLVLGNYFADPVAGRPITAAKIFIGEPDKDPELFPVDVYGLQENGNTVLLPQPIRTGAGGTPIFDGSSIVIFVEVSIYSIKVKDASNSQKFYFPVINDSTEPLIVGEVSDLPATVGSVCIVEDVLRGGIFVYDETRQQENDGGTVFNGWVRQYSGDVTIEMFGGIPDDPGTDNAPFFFNALQEGRRVLIGSNKTYYSTPIRLGTSANNCSIVGHGKESVISLLSSATGFPGVPLLHIPQDGGSYGGTEIGAKNVFIDNLRLYGGDATATFSTTGLVVENAENFRFGTIWCNGFYKSGMLITGTPSTVRGDKYFGYDNGNQVGASTGGQGFAVASDNEDFTSVFINYAECWGNGLDNTGTGADLNKGMIKIGTLNCHDNGTSGAKVVTAKLIDIDTFICTSNNKQVGETFASFYSNGVFGNVIIGSFYSVESAGAALSLSTEGAIKISTIESIDSGLASISVTAGTLSVGSADILDTLLTGVSISGTGDATFARLKIKGSPNQSVVVTGGSFTAGHLEVIDSTGSVLLGTGGRLSVVSTYAQKASGTTAITLTSGVINASFNNIRTSGYALALNDGGVGTYAPNIA